MEFPHNIFCVVVNLYDPSILTVTDDDVPIVPDVRVVLMIEGVVVLRLSVPPYDLLCVCVIDLKDEVEVSD